MTRPPRRLQDSLEVVRVTPRVATTMLIHGLLPPGDTENFKPANLTVQTIIKMLYHANEVRNRTVSLPQVEKWSRDMTAGRWLWTGEPIQIDTDGFVRNGQHRLLAVVHSGTTHDMVVVKGIDPRAQLVIDVGRTRTIANQMHLLEVGGAPVATSIANTLLRWRAGKAMLSAYIPTVLEVEELIRTEPAIAEALPLIYRIRSTMKRMPHSAIGATYVEATHIDVEQRDLFFDALMTGANLESNNPILVLRNKLTSQGAHNVKSRRAGQLYLIVKAWNHWRKGETIQLLRVPQKLTSATFPTMH